MSSVSINHDTINAITSSSLTSSLNVSLPQAIGHLVLLWLRHPSHSKANAALSPLAIATAAEWTGDPVIFTRALLDAGILQCSQRGFTIQRQPSRHDSSLPAHDLPVPEPHPIPADFAPSPSMIAFAQGLGLDLATISFQTELFRDHFLAKRHERRTDWAASWRKWMRNVAHGTFTSHTPNTPYARTAINFERARARLGIATVSEQIIEAQGQVR